MLPPVPTDLPRARPRARPGLRTVLALAVPLAFAPRFRAEAQSADRCLPAAQVPAAVRAHVAPGSCAVALERADVDTDGRPDALVVLGRPGAPDPDRPADAAPRTLLVLVGTPTGDLRLAARAPRAVMCATCGGVMGDPFVALVPRSAGFTIQHLGGSGWRWTADYTFGWSRRDAAWQLVRVERTTFHAGDPTRVQRRIARPPRDFGKIDLRAFDGEDWEGRGAR
jgi:hypothetical protein